MKSMQDTQLPIQIQEYAQKVHTESYFQTSITNYSYSESRIIIIINIHERGILSPNFQNINEPPNSSTFQKILRFIRKNRAFSKNAGFSKTKNNKTTQITDSYTKNQILSESPNRTPQIREKVKISRTMLSSSPRFVGFPKTRIFRKPGAVKKFRSRILMHKTKLYQNHRTANHRSEEKLKFLEQCHRHPVLCVFQKPAFFENRER